MQVGFCDARTRAFDAQNGDRRVQNGSCGAIMHALHLQVACCFPVKTSVNPITSSVASLKASGDPITSFCSLGTTSGDAIASARRVVKASIDPITNSRRVVKASIDPIASS
ncbi:MAG TPA: hypothetical protein VGY54_02045 [Polyangiaceae bacterium]|nr:hypothetical protein [Polyangiaceae bacterium]